MKIKQVFHAKFSPIDQYNVISKQFIQEICDRIITYMYY